MLWYVAVKSEYSPSIISGTNHFFVLIIQNQFLLNIFNKKQSVTEQHAFLLSSYDLYPLTSLSRSPL